MEGTSGRTIVIGIGNPYQGDEGVGPRVVDALAAEVDAAAAAAACSGRPGRLGSVDLERSDGDPSQLAETLHDAGFAVVVDAMWSGLPPGSVRVFDQAAGARPCGAIATAHAAAIGEARSLAALAGRPPARLLVVGIEAGDRLAAGLGEAVERAVPAALRLVRAALATQPSCGRDDPDRVRSRAGRP